MRCRRVHHKVWLAWGRWWAVQLVLNPREMLNLGIHPEPLRPLLDVFLGPVTIAFGNHPALTDSRTAQRHSCRGFFIGDYPEEAIF